MKWTEAKVETLTSLIARKASAAVAAEVLGCTRDAALGKARGLGLKFQGQRHAGVDPSDRTGPPAKVGVNWDRRLTVRRRPA